MAYLSRYFEVTNNPPPESLAQFISFDIARKSLSTFNGSDVEKHGCGTGYCMHDSGSLIDLPCEKKSLYLNPTADESSPVRDV